MQMDESLFAIAEQVTPLLSTLFCDPIYNWNLNRAYSQILQCNFFSQTDFSCMNIDTFIHMIHCPYYSTVLRKCIFFPLQFIPWIRIHRPKWMRIFPDPHHGLKSRAGPPQTILHKTEMWNLSVFRWRTSAWFTSSTSPRSTTSTRKHSLLLPTLIFQYPNQSF